MNLFEMWTFLATHQVKVFISVVVVAIAVGLLLLTWKQYQQPAHLKTAVYSHELRAIKRTLLIVFRAKLAVIISGSLFLLWGIWDPKYWQVSLSGFATCALFVFSLFIVRSTMRRNVFTTLKKT